MEGRGQAVFVGEHAGEHGAGDNPAVKAAPFFIHQGEGIKVAQKAVILQIKIGSQLQGVCSARPLQTGKGGDHLPVDVVQGARQRGEAPRPGVLIKNNLVAPRFQPAGVLAPPGGKKHPGLGQKFFHAAQAFPDGPAFHLSLDHHADFAGMYHVPCTPSTKWK